MSLFVWGSGRESQLGVECHDRKFCVRTPTALSDVGTVVHAACGEAHTLAVTEVGDVVSFGRSREGQLGRRSEDVLGVVEGLEDEVVLRAACGAFHSNVVTASGRVYEFGLCHSSTVRNEGTEQEATTTAGAAPARELRTGFDESDTVLSRIVRESTLRWLAAVDDDDMVAQVDDAALLAQSEAFSDEERRATIGLARMDARRAPVHRPRLARGLENHNVVAISCGYGHTLALTNDGRAFGTGYNDRGQVGVGHRVNLDRFVQIDFFLRRGARVVHVAAGSQHSLAVVSTTKERKNQLFAWGQGSLGQLGLGRRVTGRLRPVPITLLKDTKDDDDDDDDDAEPVKCAAGANHSVALDSRGDCYFWGHAEYGQHGGLGTSHRDYIDAEFFYVPRKVSPRPPPLLDVVCGANFTVAIDEGGGLVSWGWPSHGVLGRGVNFAATTTTPTHADKLDGTLGAPRVLSIAAGAYHAVAVADDARSKHALRFAELFADLQQRKKESQTSSSSSSDSNDDSNDARDESPPSKGEQKNSKKPACDENLVEIRVEDQPESARFFAHAAILGARSRYFRGLCRAAAAAAAAADRKSIVLILPSTVAGVKVTGAMVKAVLHFIYADRVDAPPHRLRDLAKLGRAFCMDDFAELCDPTQGRAESTFAKDMAALVGDSFAADVDLRLDGGDVAIPGHRVVLETSDYFAALLRFSRGPALDLAHWGDQGQVSFDVAVAILRFIYAGVVDVDAVDPFELIVAADLLRIPSLVRTCERLLVDSMGSDRESARACLDFAANFDFCARLKCAAQNVLRQEEVVGGVPESKEEENLSPFVATT